MDIPSCRDPPLKGGFTYEDEDRKDAERLWRAIHHSAEFTGLLGTGGDFYNFFVFGLLPESCDDVPLPDPVTVPSNGTNMHETKVLDANWNRASYCAFPEDPGIVQVDLGHYGGGITTGHFYDDISTGVISIPHFDQDDWTFGQLQRVARGLHGWRSGKALIPHRRRPAREFRRLYWRQVAILLFRELFPGIDPFTGSQRRSQELGNVLDSATTRVYEEMAASDDDDERDTAMALMADEWVITTRLNAETGRNFTSWEESQGPRREKNDDFSLVEEYDLKNPNFHAAAFDGWVLDRYMDENDSERRELVWGPEDVVILTDGSCSSACAIFLELATTQGGARTVVVGGAPKPGPMQAASGTRGMRLYTNYDLDIDISWVYDLDDTTMARLPANRGDTGIYVNHISFNLRDQLRADDLSTPLQFRYAAADCRLYFTLDNVYNMSALWHDVARAAFEDPGLCVEGSTGYTSRSGNGVPKAPPRLSAVRPLAPGPATTFTVDYDPLSYDGLSADQTRTGNKVPVKYCDPRLVNECGVGATCKAFIRICGRQATEQDWINVCVGGCASFSKCPGSSKTCFTAQSRPASDGKNVLNIQQQKSDAYGICKPSNEELCRVQKPTPRPQTPRPQTPPGSTGGQGSSKIPASLKRTGSSPSKPKTNKNNRGRGSSSAGTFPAVGYH